MEILDNNDVQSEAKRPQFLTVLCILTFISTGLGILASLLMPLFSDMLVTMMQSNPSYDEAKMAEQITILQAGWGYYLFTALLAGVSLMGAIFMWKLKKLGFHLYALANLALLLLPYLVLGAAISWWGIFFTALFIVLYAVNLKHLK
jgi:hypothetical protein